MNYTVIDFILLHPIIASGMGGSEALSYSQAVVIGLREIAKERQLTQLDIEDVFRHWLDRLFNKHISIKTFNFIFKISLDDVPMYMNDPDLKSFVKWRFRIAK